MGLAEWIIDGKCLVNNYLLSLISGKLMNSPSLLHLILADLVVTEQSKIAGSFFNTTVSLGSSSKSKAENKVGCLMPGKYIENSEDICNISLHVFHLCAYFRLTHDLAKLFCYYHAKPVQHMILSRSE